MSDTKNTGDDGQTGAVREIVQNNSAQEQAGSGQTAGQTGAAPKLSPAQKMDRILRSKRTESMKKEIEKLREEASKNRIAAKEAIEARTLLEQQAAEIKSELETLKKAHRAELLMRKLDAAGCIKSTLVVKDIPENCDDIDTFIENYRSENSFLFNKNKISSNDFFKPQKSQLLSASQQMDRVIRKALGRG